MQTTETLAAGVLIAATGGPPAFAVARAWLRFHRQQRVLARILEEVMASTTRRGTTSKIPGSGITGSR